MNDKCTAAIFSAVKMQEMLVLFLAHWTSRILSKYKQWLIFFSMLQMFRYHSRSVFQNLLLQIQLFHAQSPERKCQDFFSAALTNVSVLTVGEWSIWEMQTVWDSIKVQFGAAEAECYLGMHTVQLSSATLLIYHFVSVLLHTSTTEINWSLLLLWMRPLRVLTCGVIMLFINNDKTLPQNNKRPTENNRWNALKGSFLKRQTHIYHPTPKRHIHTHIYTNTKHQQIRPKLWHLGELTV